MGVALAAGTGTAWAVQDGSPCELLSSCVGPEAKPGGLAHDGTALWVGSLKVGTMVIQRVDPTTCQSLGSIPAPGPFVGGLAWDGATLWCLPEETGRIYQLRASDGAVLRWIPAPSFGASNPNGSGLSWDGEALWHVDYGTDRIYRLDPVDGAVLASFPTPGPLPTGILWFGGVLVVADASLDDLHVIDAATGAVLGVCASPDTFGWGLAAAPDGTVHVVGSITRRFYQEDLGLAVDPFVNYCEATDNSTGGPAWMDARGSPSIAANDLVVGATGVPNGLGLFYYGPTQTQIPLAGGFLCVGSPQFRLAVVHPRGGTAEVAVDYARLPRRGSIHAGSTWNFQLLYLDRLARRGARFNLSDGLSITFTP